MRIAMYSNVTGEVMETEATRKGINTLCRTLATMRRCNVDITSFKFGVIGHDGMEESRLSEYLNSKKGVNEMKNIISENLKQEFEKVTFIKEEGNVLYFTAHEAVEDITYQIRGYEVEAGIALQSYNEYQKQYVDMGMITE